MRTQNVVVDIGNLKASDIFFVQGEKGREITFKVINSLLEDFVNLAGYTATIHILKSDGNFTIDNMEINIAKSECYYTLTENDCACGGRGFYDLSFSKNDELIYTAHGDYIGDFRSIDNDSVNSVSSAYGVTFPEGFQQKLIAGDKIHISDDNVISAEGEIYTAGDNINISTENVISATDTKYTAGDNINISTGNVISAVIPTFTTQSLFSGMAGVNSEITLSDNLSNYDMIEIIMTTDTTSGARAIYPCDVNYFKNAFPYTPSPSGYVTPHFMTNVYSTTYSRIICGSADNKLLYYEGNEFITDVIGIKF